MAASLLCGLAVAIALAYGVALHLNYHFFVEMSGSMAPALPVGSVIVAKPQVGSATRVGQIITFVAPDHSGRLITHRVREVVVRKGRTGYRTRGDANPAADSWTVRFPHQVAVEQFAIPWAGYALYALSQQFARILLVALVALAITFAVVTRLWRDELAAVKVRRRVRKAGAQF